MTELEKRFALAISDLQTQLRHLGFMPPVGADFINFKFKQRDLGKGGDGVRDLEVIFSNGEAPRRRPAKAKSRAKRRG